MMSIAAAVTLAVLADPDARKEPRPRPNWLRSPNVDGTSPDTIPPPGTPRTP